MKNKSIADKISDSIDLVKSIKKNKKTARLKQLRNPLQIMTSELEAAVNLQKAVQKLKKDLKARKKELEAQVKKLAESRKEVKKVYRKSKKTTAVVKKVKKPGKTMTSLPQGRVRRKPGSARPKKNLLGPE